MINFKDFIRKNLIAEGEYSDYNTDHRSDHDKEQEHAHLVKAYEHNKKSLHHYVNSIKLADAKKKRTPEYKREVELSNAHRFAGGYHADAARPYSHEADDSRRHAKKRIADPTTSDKVKDMIRAGLDARDKEHKRIIGKAKEHSARADALSKEHGADYSKISHRFGRISD